jgi:RNA polymerase sigma-70 factor (ECF subfamily)
MTPLPDHLQRLLDEEPFVQALTKSLVADEVDDVVQQAWLRAIERRPSGILSPRAWLARVVKNLVADQRRRRERREARQRGAAPPVHVPSSSELLEGEERRAALVNAVDRLPADQRTVVLLRYYDGLRPQRIAAELGVPVRVVWNRLHVALQTLRARLDAEHGERRAWLLPLVPFATNPRGLPWRELALPAAKTLCLGAIAMTTKTKIAAALAAVVAMALACAIWFGPGVFGHDPRPPARDAAAAATASLPAPHTPTPSSDAAARQEVAAPNADPAATGTLLVHVRYADEPKLAAGLTVLVSRPGGDFRVGVHRAVTDAAGDARFEALPPGNVRAGITAMATASVVTEIEAGASAECSLLLRGGMTLSGIVVDAAGVPVAGAMVEAVRAGDSGIDAAQVALTAADGTFVVRECVTLCLVGARAAGHAASQLYFRQGKPGAEEHVRIELGPNGGSVEGVVVGPAGEPVPDAVVRVGEGWTEWIMSTSQGAPPLPALVRTDANGRFVAIGVPPGTQPVQVRARDYAPWLGSCDVAAGLTAAQRIVLSPGVTCTGIVRDEVGQPADNVEIVVGQRGDFVLLRTRSAADGTFVLRGLPPSGFELNASKERLGKASARLAGQPGETVQCELQLSNGLVLRGRVLDDLEAPAAGAEVRCEAEGDGTRWTAVVFTDKEGHFLVPDCPPDRRLTLLVGAREHVSQQRTGIDPRAGDLALVLPRDTAPKARVVGRLLRLDGSAATGEEIQAFSPQTKTQPQRDVGTAVQADGSFALEMPAGSWSGRIYAKGHPEIPFGPLQLAAGAVVDLGTLQLTIGGTLVVRGGEPKLDYYLVMDHRGRFVCGLYTPKPPLRSELLAPGDYVLLVRGEGVAAQALPFSIQSSHETALEVRPSVGARQQFEFVVPAGYAYGWVGFDVHRDGKLLAVGSSELRDGALACAIWLAPGAYTLTTRDREPQATASFTVGSAEGAPVRVALH